MSNVRPKRRISLLVASLACLGLVSSAALARPEGHDGEARTQARMERLERGVHERLAPRLGIDEATADQLVGIFQRAALARKEAMVAVRAERKALRKLVDNGGSEAELQAQLARLDAAARKMPSPRAVFDETAKILTAEQQAKLVLAAPKLLKHGGRHHERFGKRGHAPEPSDR